MTQNVDFSDIVSLQQIHFLNKNTVVFLWNQMVKQKGFQPTKLYKQVVFWDLKKGTQITSISVTDTQQLFITDKGFVVFLAEEEGDFAEKELVQPKLFFRIVDSQGIEKSKIPIEGSDRSLFMPRLGFLSTENFIALTDSKNIYLISSQGDFISKQAYQEIALDDLIIESKNLIVGNNKGFVVNSKSGLQFFDSQLIKMGESIVIDSIGDDPKLHEILYETGKEDIVIINRDHERIRATDISSLLMVEDGFVVATVYGDIYFFDLKRKSKIRHLFPKARNNNVHTKLSKGGNNTVIAREGTVYFCFHLRWKTSR